MSEVSLKWHRNAIRNTIYLYLKHFGPFGKRAAALRLTFLMHLGILSMLRRPTRPNVAYFVNGLVARLSAYSHWVKWLAGPRFDSPQAFERLLEADSDRAIALKQVETAGKRSH
jgi:hypothetical protein